MPGVCFDVEDKVLCLLTWELYRGSFLRSFGVRMAMEIRVIRTPVSIALPATLLHTFSPVSSSQKRGSPRKHIFAFSVTVTNICNSRPFPAWLLGLLCSFTRQGGKAKQDHRKKDISNVRRLGNGIVVRGFFFLVIAPNTATRHLWYVASPSTAISLTRCISSSSLWPGRTTSTTQCQSSISLHWDFQGHIACYLLLVYYCNH
ncbi:hypothetical protein BGX38DRAFT_539736 [Terfezia claveryi]|nr:hypothetical protein BGX38DRAFT_539736 [Terfezia claveryi]